jgi:glucans biosynthesis protein
MLVELPTEDENNDNIVDPTDESLETVNLRLYLASDGQPLTETWIYQWTPVGSQQW